MRRRDFLKSSIAAGAGLAAAPLMIGGLPVTGFGKRSPFGGLADLDNDRILVLVQFAGGNDGLNTVVPLGDPAYINARKTIKIDYAQTATKTDGFVVIKGSPTNGTGLNGRLATPAASPLTQKTFKTLYDEGKLIVVQGAGYPNPNRSHFRATDIWMSGSDATTVLDTGWFGRYLDSLYPNYPTNIGANDDPLAIQIGYSLSRVLYGPNGGMGITVNSPDSFYNLVQAHPGESSTDPVPNTFAGHELAYVRTIVEESQQYSQRIKTVATAGAHTQDFYPSDPRSFAAQLKVVAQLIAGGSKTKLYMVYISGFDTHAGQTSAGGQNDLLQYVSQGIGAFMQDMEAAGAADRVIGMTFSEFGRRVKENGSNGTDHGTSAPMFLFGTQVAGGIFGNNPSLTDLDANGDLKMQYDYRQVYYSVLRNWFGAGNAALTACLPGWLPSTDDPLPLFRGSVGVAEEQIMASDFALTQNYPNPFRGSTTIEFSVNSYRDVLLEVYAENGRKVKTLADGSYEYGRHSVAFNAPDLPAGNYIVRMHSGGGVQTRVMQLIR